MNGRISEGCKSNLQSISADMRRMVVGGGAHGGALAEVVLACVGVFVWVGVRSWMSATQDRSINRFYEIAFNDRFTRSNGRPFTDHSAGKGQRGRVQGSFPSPPSAHRAPQTRRTDGRTGQS